MFALNEYSVWPAKTAAVNAALFKGGIHTDFTEKEKKNTL